MSFFRITAVESAKDWPTSHLSDKSPSRTRVLHSNIRERGCPCLFVCVCFLFFFSRDSLSLPFLVERRLEIEIERERERAFFYNSFWPTGFDIQARVIARPNAGPELLGNLCGETQIVTQILFHFTAKCHGRLVLLLLLYGEISGTRLFFFFYLPSISLRISLANWTCLWLSQRNNGDDDFFHTFIFFFSQKCDL